jgi:hypothetical protein
LEEYFTVITASFSQQALNTFIAAYAAARPRFFHYDSRLQTSNAVTGVPPIQFPGVPGGSFQYTLALENPTFDLYPPDVTNEPSAPAVGQFRLALSAQFILIGQNPVPLTVYLLGKFVLNNPQVATLMLVSVDAEGIAPPQLKVVVEAILFAVLSVALSNVQLPLRAITIEFATIQVTSGPTIDNNSIQVIGNVR